VEQHAPGVNELKEKASRLPRKPGVYFFKNSWGEIVYVGKARSLRDRVLTYFQPTSDPKIGMILAETAVIDFILTGSEKEAFFLENNFVQKHQPRFNLRLKDDKSYPYLKLTVQERFPGIYLARKVERDGAKYFGPFSPASRARQTIHILNRYFGVRACEEEIPGSRRRPCLEYDLKLCAAPCVGLVSEREYRERVDQALMFLQGRADELQKILDGKMKRSADEEDFEQAAHWRDMILAIEQVREKPQFISPRLENTDILGFHRDDGLERAAVYLFFMRQGKVTEAAEFLLGAKKESPSSEILAGFLLDHYRRDRDIPGNLILPFDPARKEEIAERLGKWRDAKGSPIKIVVPQKGKDRQLVRLISQNAESLLQKERERTGDLAEWRKLLEIEKPPRRVEGFDISNTGGAESVGSMVVFENGRPRKDDYRKYKIKTVAGPNDLASLQEVIRRRYQRLKEEKMPRPELVFVDGGLGQLHAAQAVLEELGLGRVPLASLAKREEILYSREHNEGVRLERTSPVLKHIQAVRDEAHRFAISFHRGRRAKKSFASELDDIRGLGPKRKAALLEKFESVNEIGEASHEILSRIVGSRVAGAVKARLRE